MECPFLLQCLNKTDVIIFDWEGWNVHFLLYIWLKWKLRLMYILWEIRARKNEQKTGRSNKTLDTSRSKQKNNDPVTPRNQSRNQPTPTRRSQGTPSQSRRNSVRSVDQTNS
ncbi:hypothetical protein ACJMK2_033818 [Sinanodonta woodiana]|uniref:Uncharacterized protein n=1 Tax=Sinanodonta woodiana TaxID=1069815 RepID=A0ABD3WPK4_SINWO